MSVSTFSRYFSDFHYSPATVDQDTAGISDHSAADPLIVPMQSPNKALAKLRKAVGQYRNTKCKLQGKSRQELKKAEANAPK